MSVEARVQGFIANVEYNLRYYNDEEEPIDASFVFPLHDNSAIYLFEAKISGRLVVGEVQEKEQVRKELSFVFIDIEVSFNYGTVGSTTSSQHRWIRFQIIT